jgi:hypothetical protein
MTAFDREALLDAFDQIGRAAVEAGTKLQIAVYGGSALMLASNFRFATEDVDVSRLEQPLPARRGDRRVGTRRENAQDVSELKNVRPWPLVVRRAREEDREAVLNFATQTWHGWDYVPNAWPVWLSASDGAFLVGSPQTVAAKISHVNRSLGGISRITFQMSTAALEAKAMRRSIELLGTDVAPLVRGELRY